MQPCPQGQLHCPSSPDFDSSLASLPEVQVPSMQSCRWCSPLLHEEVNDGIAPILMVEEHKQSPVHEPGALLELDQKGRKGVGIKHILEALVGPDLPVCQRLSQICCRQRCNRPGSLPAAQQAPPLSTSTLPFRSQAFLGLDQNVCCRQQHRSTVHPLVHKLQCTFHKKVVACSTTQQLPRDGHNNSAWVGHLQLSEVVHGCVPVLHQDFGGQLAPQGAQVALRVGRQGPAGQDSMCQPASTGLSCALLRSCAVMRGCTGAPPGSLAAVTWTTPSLRRP